MFEYRDLHANPTKKLECNELFKDSRGLLKKVVFFWRSWLPVKVWLSKKKNLSFPTVMTTDKSLDCNSDTEFFSGIEIGENLVNVLPINFVVFTSNSDRR